MDHITIQNRSISLDLFNKIIGRQKISRIFLPIIGWEQIQHENRENILQVQEDLFAQLNDQLSMPIEGTNLSLIIKLTTLKVRKFCHILSLLDINYIDSKVFKAVDQYNYPRNQYWYKNYSTGAYDLTDSAESVKTYLISHYGKAFWEKKPCMAVIDFSIERVDAI
ncbi:hypothetical protein [Microscilla marina]|uniref:Uncharacterized protein n=1 Tax=Microscilla marina ATCC 23134 TaxID=313606 RepID=A1ZVF8_MICM2|nr:hypothetical protein [Microscilla marina]EAY25656.1 hypothetical protein M23134_07307 [Microscilla marina ATCC 23134]